jgi:hypothetical protein
MPGGDDIGRKRHRYGATVGYGPAGQLFSILFSQIIMWYHSKKSEECFKKKMKKNEKSYPFGTAGPRHDA